MRKPLIGAIMLLVGLTIAHLSLDEGFWPAALSACPMPLAAQGQGTVTVPAGTRILIRTIDPIDSSKQKTGYRFTAALETNLQAGGVVVAARGTTIHGRLVQASSAGKMKGSSQLSLELTDIVIQGTAHPLLTNTFDIKGKGEGGQTAKKV